MAALSELLRQEGAEIIEIPTIELKELEDYSRLREAINHLQEYNWVVFTSANAVDFFFKQGKRFQLVPEMLAQKKLAAIGPATAARLGVYSLRTDLVAGDSRAEGLGEAFKSYSGAATLNRMKILLPRAREARETLPLALRQLGAVVDDVPVYRSVEPEIDFNRIDRQLAGRRLDVATFTSSSAVRNLLRAAAASGRAGFLDGVRIAAIGPVTAETLKQLGLCPDIVPAKYAIADLAQAIVAFFTSSPTTKTPRN